MSTFKVLVPDAHLRDLDVERAVTGMLVDYEVYDETDPSAIADSAWAACDAILVWHRMKITRELVGKLARCRMIVRVGVGFDNVDVDACREYGIPVSNVPNYGTTEVADHAIAMLLFLARGIGTYEARLKADLANGFMAESVPVVRRLRGGTFGAVGMGRIGTAIARRAAAHDMHVVYYDPHVPEGHELGLGYERVKTLEALLGRADVVSLHTPLSDETRNLMSDSQFQAMKPGALFINIARGKLVDVDALYRALRSGHVAAAGLDVLPQEPPVPAPALLDAWRKNEAWLAGRLVITPHAAFYSEAGYLDMRTFSAEMLVDYLVDGRLRNNVNPGWRDAATSSNR
ncbi:dehydrogenase [Burkholderia sp. Leaf177]|uniref:C-terminal binding protein n=1 Tax=Burkholderia sp. Leaf177 TaxID=1736287 RepID=UPI0006F615F9|nr:C-terminal binding protein [Burkholderia sp. Leaf177]KQR81781.1 dehydrogenase [Burkholderia sp. Leaf177]